MSWSSGTNIVIKLIKLIKKHVKEDVNMFKKDLQIVCHYKNSEGGLLQRTFWLSEILLNEHINVLTIMPGYEFVGFDYPEYR